MRNFLIVKTQFFIFLGAFAIFGKKRLWPAIVQLASLNETGDAIAVILISLSQVDFGNNYSVGQSYLIFDQLQKRNEII